MINFRDSIDTIKRHLEDGSDRALTYAALECRLVIERICYDRLARVHEYISHDEVRRRWQPRHIIKFLEDDVDPLVSSTYTLSISTEPVVEGENLAEKDYVPVGMQQGFDGAKLGKLWNALSRTALHVSLPKSKEANVTQFGNPETIRAKVEEVLIELERIATGTMTSNGFGPSVSFTCRCGQHNKRRSQQLSDGKIIQCSNPECPESYEVKFEGEDINFNFRDVHVSCKCGETRIFPMTQIEKLTVNDFARQSCNCGAEIILRLQLLSAVRDAE